MIFTIFQWQIRRDRYQFLIRSSIFPRSFLEPIKHWRKTKKLFFSSLRFNRNLSWNGWFLRNKIISCFLPISCKWDSRWSPSSYIHIIHLFDSSENTTNNNWISLFTSVGAYIDFIYIKLIGVPVTFSSFKILCRKSSRLPMEFTIAYRKNNSIECKIVISRAFIIIIKIFNSCFNNDDFKSFFSWNSFYITLFAL